jgi:hypothetical protein
MPDDLASRLRVSSQVDVWSLPGVVLACGAPPRRTNATQLIASGVDVKTAQAQLGHRDPRLTLAVYAPATSEGDRRAAELLSQRFFGSWRTDRAQTL